MSGAKIQINTAVRARLEFMIAPKPEELTNTRPDK